MFEFVKEQYDELTTQLLNGEFSVNATITIAGQEVHADSLFHGMSDTIDGRITEGVQLNYPKDLPTFKRVKVFPLERMFTRHEGDRIQEGIAGRYAPFDRWISVHTADVRIRNNKTYFDVAISVIIQSISYKIKGIVEEQFGNKPVTHAFLVKDTE